MTVQELIKKLKQFDADRDLVFVAEMQLNYEDDSDEYFSVDSVEEDEVPQDGIEKARGDDPRLAVFIHGSHS